MWRKRYKHTESIHVYLLVSYFSPPKACKTYSILNSCGKHGWHSLTSDALQHTVLDPNCKKIKSNWKKDTTSRTRRSSFLWTKRWIITSFFQIETPQNTSRCNQKLLVCTWEVLQGLTAVSRAFADAQTICRWQTFEGPLYNFKKKN